MQLSKYNAKDIVSEINTIINQNINMMNEEGVIIASTDEKRIGTYHAGAKEIIDKNLDELIIKEDQTYSGSKEGANFSIIVQDKIVGVIGITGPYQEVSKYGQIIRKITEILLVDALLQEKRNMDESVKNRFLSEWLQNENKIINKVFIERGLRMHIDITVPRRIIVISAFEDGNIQNSLEEMCNLELAEQHVKNYMNQLSPDSIYIKEAFCLILGVTNRSDKDMLQLAEKIRGNIEKESSVRVAIGIDDCCHPYTMANISYVKAKKALQSCLRTHKVDIRSYNDINMEIFTDEISDISKTEYVQKVFRGYSFADISDNIGILEIFYGMEGSVTAASEKLHMHKNTLQYKLKKIKERTGYDPRSIKYSSLFYIAIYFYREVRGLMVEEN